MGAIHSPKFATEYYKIPLLFSIYPKLRTRSGNTVLVTWASGTFGRAFLVSFWSRGLQSTENGFLARLRFCTTPSVTDIQQFWPLQNTRVVNDRRLFGFCVIRSCREKDYLKCSSQAKYNES